jgi:hypothetical protein
VAKRVRGLLRRDYERLRRLVAAGEITWENAITAGYCAPKAKTGRKPKPIGRLRPLFRRPVALRARPDAEGGSV